MISKAIGKGEITLGISIGKKKDHSLALDIGKRHEKREKNEKKTERLVRSSKKKSNKEEKRTMPCNNNSEVFQEDSEQ